MNLAEEADRYHRELQFFVGFNNLPRHWFAHRDHFAVKAYNPDDYSSLISNYKNISEYIAEELTSRRRIAVAKLLGEFSIKFTACDELPGGEIRYLEIIEALPDDQGSEGPMLNHEEIYFENGMLPIRSVLRRKGLRPTDVSMPKCESLSVVFNDELDELIFSDKTIEEITANKLNTHRAILL